MDLIRIESDHGHLVQGCIRVDWPDVRARRTEIDRFVRMYMATVAASMAASLHARFIALDLDLDGHLSTTHAWTSSPSDAGTLRMVLAAFVRLGTFPGANSAIPENAADFQKRFVQFEADRLAIDQTQALTKGGVAIRHNLQLGEMLAAMMDATAMFGLGFRYECAAVPCRPDRDLIRDSQYQIARLEHETAAPRDLIADQKKFGERLTGATHHLQEAIIPHEGADDVLRTVVTDTALGGVYGRIGLVPDLVRLDPNVADALAFMTHPWMMDGPPAALSEDDSPGLALGSQVRSRLGCATLLARLGVSTPDDEVAASSPLETLIGLAGCQSPSSADRSPDGDNRPFLFVSYARHDWDQVAPTIDWLRSQNVNLWIDSDIHGGDSWLDALERNIVRSAGVLTFVSQAYIASRFCVGEARFAMTLDRPFIPVRLDDHTLSGGVAFIMASIQFIRSDDPEFQTKLIRSIAANASTVMPLGSDGQANSAEQGEASPDILNSRGPSC